MASKPERKHQTELFPQGLPNEINPVTPAEFGTDMLPEEFEQLYVENDLSNPQ